MSAVTRATARAPASQLGFGSDSLPPGTDPDVTEGTWDGADLLRLRTRPYTLEPNGVAHGETDIGAGPVSSDLPTWAIQFGLRRSTEEAFDAACAERR
jgi:hypothetical protein